MTDRPTVVALWYELTPYHAFALERIHRELGEVRMINVFTHSVRNNSMPWRIALPEGVEVVHDERHAIPNEAKIHRGFLGTFRFIRGVIDRERPLFVLTAGHEDVARWMLIPYLRTKRIPYVLWGDSNVYGLDRGQPVKDALRRRYLRTILRGFDGFMPMGTCGKAYLRVLGCGGKPMFLRPYEPDYRLVERRDPDAEAELLARLKLDPSRKRFLYSGRLISKKRVDLLLQAFEAIADAVPDWDVLVAGGGPLEAQLRDSVPPRLRHRVCFTGFLQMADVRNCYHVSHALVHPSEFEPWALVINEAAAAGLAIIATEITGAAVELVRHNVNGMLVAPGRRADLERAMLRVADPATLARMRQSSPRILADWRLAADPVDGLREAVEHFRQAAR